MFYPETIIGLTVVAVKGWQTGKKRKSDFEPKFILFSDKATYVELIEQDYHDYHDCSTSARLLRTEKDPIMWKHLFEDDESYPNADTFI